MRKVTIVFLVVLLLLVLGSKPVADYMLEERKQVQITEHILEGDSSTIEGVTIELPVRWLGHQYWDITYTAGKQPSVNTDYRFYPSWDSESKRREMTYRGLYFMSYTDFIWDAEYPVSETNERLASVAETIELGERKEREDVIIRISDYVEYYPLMIAMDIPQGNGYRRVVEEEEEWCIAEALAQFLRIPVLEDEVRNLSIKNNGKNYVSGYGYAEGDEFRWQESTACGEEAVYFTFWPYSDFGKLMDTSLIPGGYGIYRLPYHVNGDQAEIDTDGLEMMYSIQPEELRSECYLVLDDHGNLLLFYETEEGINFVVLDPKSGEEKQKLHLETAKEDMDFTLVTLEDDFFVYSYGWNNYYVVDWDSARGYEKQISIEVEDYDPISSRQHMSKGMDWDGERLIYVDFVRYGANGMDLDICDFLVAVYDKTGRIYCGQYENSLHARSELQEAGNMSCVPHNYAGIKVFWPEEK